MAILKQTFKLILIAIAFAMSAAVARAQFREGHVAADFGDREARAVVADRFTDRQLGEWDPPRAHREDERIGAPIRTSDGAQILDEPRLGPRSTSSFPAAIAQERR